MHACQWPSSIIGAFQREKNGARVNFVYPTFLILAILRHVFGDENLE